MALNISDFTLVWGDEFNDLSLGDSLPRNGKRWFTQQTWGGGFSNATFMPSTSNVFSIVQKGGETALQINMTKNAAGTLESGIISNVFPDGTSEANQTTREGYYEARMWLPDPHPGIWPAFWSIEVERTKSVRDHVMELDVLEHYGAAMPDRYTTAIHDWDWNNTTLQGHSSIYNRKVAGNNVMNTGWHTYGIEIGADGSQTYFFDRKPYYFVSGDASNNFTSTYNTMVDGPLGWMINLAAGGGWPIDPKLGTPEMPAALWVDYFRIYKRVSGTAGDVGPGDPGDNPPPPPPPDEEEPPTGVTLPTVSVTDATKVESGENLSFDIKLSAAQTVLVSVNYETADGTATADTDYTATSGTVTFEAGETTKTVLVPILNDQIEEPSEAVELKLDKARMELVISDGTGTGTITDDDAPPPPPPPPSEITGTAADETLVGTAQADTIFGLAGRDTIYGRAGDDVIVGGPGIDTLFGEGGNDVFKYGPDAKGWTDTIRDWAPGDKIDLSTLRSTEPFTFIGNAAFTGIRQVRLTSSTFSGVNYTIVEVNVDGTVAADLVISLRNAPTLTETDFIL